MTMIAKPMRTATTVTSTFSAARWNSPCLRPIADTKLGASRTQEPDQCDATQAFRALGSGAQQMRMVLQHGGDLVGARVLLKQRFGGFRR
jgi:hypothetical protein